MKATTSSTTDDGPGAGGTIGFSFAAAMGAKIACLDKPVVAVIGDGGFLYSSQELATCMRHGIRFPVIVVNDNAYGVIRYLQRESFQPEKLFACTSLLVLLGLVGDIIYHLELFY